MAKCHGAPTHSVHIESPGNLGRLVENAYVQINKWLYIMNATRIRLLCTLFLTLYTIMFVSFVKIPRSLLVICSVAFQRGFGVRMRQFLMASS